jgi:hypothetical protein
MALYDPYQGHSIPDCMIKTQNRIIAKIMKEEDTTAIGFHNDYMKCIKEYNNPQPVLKKQLMKMTLRKMIHFLPSKIVIAVTKKIVVKKMITYHKLEQPWSKRQIYQILLK